MLSNLVNLFFPDNCPGCGYNFLRGESVICQRCLNSLPKTNYHQRHDNPWPKISRVSQSVLLLCIILIR